MNEFEILTKDEFFIIDSNDLESVKSKLYGFFIEDGKIIRNYNFTPNINLSPIGSYIYIEKSDEKIIIRQDFDGSYGIYLFKNNDRSFCISNSFIYLLDYVKERYSISLNEDYAKSYLASVLCSFGYRQTLINEIETLPRNFIVEINLKTKKINFKKINYNEKTVALNSKEGIKILDGWFYRWTSLFHNLKKHTNNITADLSGGFDSRVALTLLLSSDIDLNEINVNSINDGKHVHGEDYRIASQIAREFNFKLNDTSNLNQKRYYFQNIETPINISFYTKLGFHNQMYYQKFRNIQTLYSIGGQGGEIIRGHYSDTKESLLNFAKSISPDLSKSTERILKYNQKTMEKDLNMEINDENFALQQYNEVRRRYHFAKGTVEKYLSNTIHFTPLTDALLNQLKITDENCDDSELLIALIYLRYCPRLIEFDVEGGREIKAETIEYARKINKNHPFIRKEILNKEIQKEEMLNLKVTEEKYNLGDINNFLKKIFFSQSYKKTFEKHYSPEIYEFLKNKVETMNYFALQHAYPTFAVLKAINDINKNDETLFEWLNQFVEIPNTNKINENELKSLLLNYFTARVDIVNYGVNNNDIDIIHCSDENARIYEPLWLKQKDVYGKIIQSHEGSLDLMVRCISNGKLKISLRGKDIYDKNKKRFPIYIDFTKLIVDGENILNEPELVWHDTPFSYMKPVRNGDFISIHIEWKPFDKNSSWNA